ncbi:3-demethylubiquinone-9 3-methyltransferase [Brevibacterium sp. 239c]|nr:3-demethylubiquinone-9 3-methyltransferase [Brevibacterium sp. 239c]
MPSPIRPRPWFTDHAVEAMEFSCSVFPNSHIVSIDRYPDESLNPHYAGMSGKVIKGIFELDGNRFICLDGGPAFTFNEAITLTDERGDQAEIDHYGRRYRLFTPASSAAGSRTSMGSVGRSFRPTSAS